MWIYEKKLQYPVKIKNPNPALAKYIKETSEGAKVVFIGPCTAKKAEAQLESVKPYVDSVLTFEELQALFDSKDFDIMVLEKKQTTIAYRCPHCGAGVMSAVSMFHLKGSMIRLKCDCGKSVMEALPAKFSSKVRSS